MLVLWTAAGSTAANAQAQPGRCPSAEMIDCTPTRNCEKAQDTRDCDKCILSAFGRCQYRANDPACEAAKAAQDSAYAVEKAQCEAEKAAQKAQCEATKEAVKRSAAECAQQK